MVIEKGNTLIRHVQEKRFILTYLLWQLKFHEYRKTAQRTWFKKKKIFGPSALAHLANPLLVSTGSHIGAGL